jgi:hypothetical protein
MYLYAKTVPCLFCPQGNILVLWIMKKEFFQVHIIASGLFSSYLLGSEEFYYLSPSSGELLFLSRHPGSHISNSDCKGVRENSSHG